MTRGIAKLDYDDTCPVPPGAHAPRVAVRPRRFSSRKALTAAALVVSVSWVATTWVPVHANRFPASFVSLSFAPLRVSSLPQRIRVGDLVVLTIAGDVPVPALRVRAFDRDWLPFPVDARTWRVLIGVDLDVTRGVYPIEIEAAEPDAIRTTYLLTVNMRGFRTRALTVDEALVTPPAEARPRIEREALRLARLWESPTGTRLWQGPFVLPVPDAANSAFGTRSVYNGQPRSPHSGTDFLSPDGRPVKAPNSGRVVLAESLYFTGGTVVIDHGIGLLSLFAHLSTIGVQEGDSVATGDVIGQVGATGRVTGPHLHWSVRAGGSRVDPLSVLAALGTIPQGRSRGGAAPPRK